MERQGFGIRLGALLIDILVLILISFIVGLIFGHGLTFSYRYGTPQGGIGYSLVTTLLTLGYWSTEIFNAASPGKKLLGLRIASETGSEATQNQLVMRWAFKNAANLLGLVATLIGAVIPILGFILGIGSLLAALAIGVGCCLALGQTRQALHDILAHTAVYRLAPTPGQGFPVMPPPPPPAV